MAYSEDDLLCRIETLEKRLARMGFAGLGAMLLVVTAAFAWPQVEEAPAAEIRDVEFGEVTAQSVVIQDPAHPSAKITLSIKENGAWLTLIDLSRHEQASVCAGAITGLTVFRVDEDEIVVAARTGLVGEGDERDAVSLLSSVHDTGSILLSAGDESAAGGTIFVRNKTGEAIVTLDTDQYGNGIVGAWNREGEGRTLKPGP